MMVPSALSLCCGIVLNEAHPGFVAKQTIGQQQAVGGGEIGVKRKAEDTIPVFSDKRMGMKIKHKNCLSGLGWFSLNNG